MEVSTLLAWLSVTRCGHWLPEAASITIGLSHFLLELSVHCLSLFQGGRKSCIHQTTETCPTLYHHQSPLGCQQHYPIDKDNKFINHHQHISLLVNAGHEYLSRNNHNTADWPGLQDLILKSVPASKPNLRSLLNYSILSFMRIECNGAIS